MWGISGDFHSKGRVANMNNALYQAPISHVKQNSCPTLMVKHDKEAMMQGSEDKTDFKTSMRSLTCDLYGVNSV